MTTNHTPTPWTASLQTGKPNKRLGLAWIVNGPQPINGADLPERVCDCYGYLRAPANARLIVQAVNSHAALVAALQLCIDAILKAKKQGPLCPELVIAKNEAYLTLQNL